MLTWNFMMKVNLFISRQKHPEWALGLPCCQWEMVQHARKILHQTTHTPPIAFASKSLTSAEHRYSNIQREALGMLHGLEKFHHYCFARDVNVIKDHKPLVAIFKNDEVTLSQRIQCILLRIHQYRVRIFYKPGLEFFIANWLFRHNHKENRVEAIHGMDMSRHGANNDTCPRIHVHTADPASHHTRQAFVVIKMHYNSRLTRHESNYTKTWDHFGHSKLTWQW